MTRRRSRAQRGLFMLLLLVLALVPVFQSAHMLTHIHADDAVADVHVSDSASLDDEANPDIDKICLDCLALTVFSVVLPILLVYLLDEPSRQLLPHLESVRRLLDFSSPYPARAPPQF